MVDDMAGFLDGMQGVRGSNPLSSTTIYQRQRPGQLPSSRANPQETPGGITVRQACYRRFEIVGI